MILLRPATSRLRCAPANRATSCSTKPTAIAKYDGFTHQCLRKINCLHFSLDMDARASFTSSLLTCAHISLRNFEDKMCPQKCPQSCLPTGGNAQLNERAVLFRASQLKRKLGVVQIDSASARVRKSFAPSPRHALPCIHASVVGFVEANLSSMARAFFVCEK